MKEIPTLKFSNPTFRDGFNVTVRLGRKWLGVKKAVIEFAPGFRRVVQLETYTVPFEHIDETYLQFEHDPTCRTLEGLAVVMKELYPEFTEESTVTVAIFYLSHHIPVVGEHVYKPDMAPVCVGDIVEVIPLNDGFWEIHYMGVYNTGDEKWGRFIAHEMCDWHEDIGYGEDDTGGWFDYRGK